MANYPRNDRQAYLAILDRWISSENKANYSHNGEPIDYPEDEPEFYKKIDALLTR